MTLVFANTTEEIVWVVLNDLLMLVFLVVKPSSTKSSTNVF